MEYQVTDNQLWRKERLIKVEKMAAKFMSMTVDQLRKHVSKMSDEKGTLFVFWKGEDPTQFQRQCFMNSWWACGEKEDFVFHVSGVMKKAAEEVA